MQKNIKYDNRIVMKQIQVGLIGFGTVGSGTAQVLYEQAERIKKRSGVSIVLKKVADISVDALPGYLAPTELTRDANDIINDPDIDIIVETPERLEKYKDMNGLIYKSVLNEGIEIYAK